jgi:hypothetical protein
MALKSIFSNLILPSAVLTQEVNPVGGVPEAGLMLFREQAGKRERRPSKNVILMLRRNKHNMGQFNPLFPDFRRKKGVIL